jgi:hypothetical protein
VADRDWTCSPRKPSGPLLEFVYLPIKILIASIS